MKIYFIVHGNVKTGMGHIIRSISLADAFRAHGHTVSFFSKYKEGIRLLYKAGIDVCKIPSAPYPARQGFFMVILASWKRISRSSVGRSQKEQMLSLSIAIIYPMDSCQV